MDGNKTAVNEENTVNGDIMEFENDEAAAEAYLKEAENEIQMFAEQADDLMKLSNNVVQEAVNNGDMALVDLPDAQEVLNKETNRLADASVKITLHGLAGKRYLMRQNRDIAEEIERMFPKYDEMRHPVTVIEKIGNNITISINEGRQTLFDNVKDAFGDFAKKFSHDKEGSKQTLKERISAGIEQFKDTVDKSLHDALNKCSQWLKDDIDNGVLLPKAIDVVRDAKEQNEADKAFINELIEKGYEPLDAKLELAKVKMAVRFEKTADVLELSTRPAREWFKESAADVITAAKNAHDNFTNTVIKVATDIKDTETRITKAAHDRWDKAIQSARADIAEMKSDIKESAQVMAMLPKEAAKEVKETLDGISEKFKAAREATKLSKATERALKAQHKAEIQKIEDEIMSAKAALKSAEKAEKSAIHAQYKLKSQRDALDQAYKASRNKEAAGKEFASIDKKGEKEAIKEMDATDKDFSKKLRKIEKKISVKEAEIADLSPSEDAEEIAGIRKQIEALQTKHDKMLKLQNTAKEDKRQEVFQRTEDKKDEVRKEYAKAQQDNRNVRADVTQKINEAGERELASKVNREEAEKRLEAAKQQLAITKAKESWKASAQMDANTAKYVEVIEKAKVPEIQTNARQAQADGFVMIQMPHEALNSIAKKNEETRNWTRFLDSCKSGLHNLNDVFTKDQAKKVIDAVNDVKVKTENLRDKIGEVQLDFQKTNNLPVENAIYKLEAAMDSLDMATKGKDAIWQIHEQERCLGQELSEERYAERMEERKQARQKISDAEKNLAAVKDNDIIRGADLIEISGNQIIGKYDIVVTSQADKSIRDIAIAEGLSPEATAKVEAAAAKVNAEMESYTVEVKIMHNELTNKSHLFLIATSNYLTDQYNIIFKDDGSIKSIVKQDMEKAKEDKVAASTMICGYNRDGQPFVEYSAVANGFSSKFIDSIAGAREFVDQVSRGEENTQEHDQHKLDDIFKE